MKGRWYKGTQGEYYGTEVMLLENKKSQDFWQQRKSKKKGGGEGRKGLGKILPYNLHKEHGSARILVPDF